MVTKKNRSTRKPRPKASEPKYNAGGLQDAIDDERRTELEEPRILPGVPVFVRWPPGEPRFGILVRYNANAAPVVRLGAVTPKGMLTGEMGSERTVVASDLSVISPRARLHCAVVDCDASTDAISDGWTLVEPYGPTENGFAFCAEHEGAGAVIAKFAKYVDRGGLEDSLNQNIAPAGQRDVKPEKVASDAERERKKVEKQGERAARRASGTTSRAAAQSPLEKALGEGKMLTRMESLVSRSATIREYAINEATAAGASDAELARINEAIDRGTECERKIIDLEERGHTVPAEVRKMLHEAMDEITRARTSIRRNPTNGDEHPASKRLDENTAIVDRATHVDPKESEEYRLALTCTCSECSVDVGDFCVEKKGRGRNVKFVALDRPHAIRVEQATKARDLINRELAKRDAPAARDVAPSSGETIRQREVRAAKERKVAPLACAIPRCDVTSDKQSGRGIEFGKTGATDVKWFCDRHVVDGEAWEMETRVDCVHGDCSSYFRVREHDGTVPLVPPNVVNPPTGWWTHEVNLVDEFTREHYCPGHQPQGRAATIEHEKYLWRAGLKEHDAIRFTRTQVDEMIAINERPKPPVVDEPAPWEHEAVVEEERMPWD